MLSHLNGQGHKRNVALRLDPRHSDMSRAALTRFAVENSQNRQRLSKLIKTIQSDALYPWPAGKNPRGRERGGPGGEVEVEDWAISGVSGGRKRPARDRSSFPDSLERPQSKEEAEEMIQMGRRLLQLVLWSDFTNLDQRQKENLSQVVERILGPRP